MNINTSYFLYTKKFETFVIDRETGISYPATFAYKTPATAELLAAYQPFGGVGYLATEYNVFRIDETGEEFVYPFSFGYADPEEVMQIWRTRQPVQAQYTVSPIGRPDEQSEPMSIEQAIETVMKPAARPQRNGIPNPLTHPAEHRAYVESQKREDIMRRYPLMRLAADLAAAIGQPEREGHLHLALEIVKDARWVHPQDEQARSCYHELRDALELTDAPLPEVRRLMAGVADGFGK